MGFGNTSAVQLTANWRIAQRTIERKTCEHMSRRVRLESDTPAWLKYYLKAAYPSEWGNMHLKIIAGAERAMEQGSKGGTMCPRGSGKSVVSWGIALKFALTGKARFPVVLPWSSKDLRKTLRFFKAALCYNKQLADDYPEYCQPFVKSGGSSQKCLTLLWEDTGTATGAEIRMSDGMIIFPDGLGAIGSATINGNPKGLNHTTKAGSVLRPDFCLIDDPQDKEVAKSPTLVASTIDVIDTDVLGMAGPEHRMPAFMSITASRPGDVAEHYSKAKDWSFVCVPQIISWPKDRKLWDELGVMLLDHREDDARKFYKKNKSFMREGFEVSWEARYDKGRKEPDAYYSAMRDFYVMGEGAFMSERQNEPRELSVSAYQLTPALVSSRVNGFPRLSLPPQVEWVVAASDVNYVGMNWVMLAATRDGAAYVPAYGCYTAGRSMLFDPKREPKQAEAAAIQRGCLSWMNEMNNITVLSGDKPMHVQIAGVDCGDWSELIIPAINSIRLPMKVWPVRGNSSTKYRIPKDAVRFGPGWHVAQWKLGRVIALNADMYKETAQRSFLAEPGMPGSISLYQPQNKAEHDDFAEHICGERLEEHVSTQTSEFYKWARRPGARWDKLDALTYARALLSVAGLSASGETVPVITRPRRPRSSGVIRI